MSIVIRGVYSHGLDEKSHEDAPCLVWTRVFTRRWDGTNARFPRAGNAISVYGEKQEES
jgi:hypothetical protein